jgi:exopolyphosphatase/guanosine-5'-triphosphate,3'-diphosphate pyrophosphatase
MRVERGQLVLRIPKGLRSLAGDRVSNRLRQLGRLIGREPVLLVG